MPAALLKSCQLLGALLIISYYEVFLITLPKELALIIDNVAVSSITGCAAVACGWLATRAQGWERRWRVFGAAALGSEAIGQTLWTGYEIAGRAQPASPSLTDLTWLSGVVLAIAGSLTVARHASRRRHRPLAGLGRCTTCDWCWTAC